MANRPDMPEEAYDPIQRDTRSEAWKCYRCEIVLPSPADGRPPVTCLQEVGGCGRSIDWDDEAGYTRFFPSDWHPDKVALYVEADLSIGQKVFTKIVREFERLIEFSNSWHARICALFVIQTYLFDRLPAVFYIGLGGPKSSGKTAILEKFNGLCRNPVLTGDISVAAMVRKLDSECTLLIDEIDELDSEKRDLVYGALRGGYRPDRLYVRYDYRKKDFEEVKTYGPKAYSFQNEPEDALRSRTFIIDTVRLRENVVNTVVANMTWDPAALRRCVAEFVDASCSGWGRERVLETMRDESFAAGLTSVLGDHPFPRNAELAAVCLVISKIAGIDVLGEATEALGEQDGIDEWTVEIGAAVKDLFTPSKIGDYKLLKDVRDVVNVTRKQSGEKPIHHKSFRKALKEIGLREKKELKRLARDGRHILVWTEHANKCFDALGQPDASPESFTPRYKSFTGWFTDAITSPKGEAKEPMVKNQGEMVKRLGELSRTLSKASSEGGAESFTREEFTTESEKFGISAADALKWLDKWVQDGEAYSPSMGRYRMIV